QQLGCRTRPVLKRARVKYFFFSSRRRHTRSKRDWVQTCALPICLTSTSYAELLEKNPVRAVEKAIKGMLPSNRLSDQVIKKLKVYEGTEHPHAAQQPKEFIIDQVAQYGHTLSYRRHTDIKRQ